MAMLTRLTSSGAATAPGSPKALQRFQNCIAFLIPSALQQARRQKTTQIDAIDCFTNELVSRKKIEWKQLRDNLTRKKAVASGFEVVTKDTFNQSLGLMSKRVMEDLQELRSPQLGLDIRSLSQAQLDNLLLSTLEIKNKVDFLHLIRQCIRYQQLPSNEVLVACLKYLSSMSLIQQIESFADICRAQGHVLTQVYADLAPFRAMALWHSGRTDFALTALLKGYAASSKTDVGRRMIRLAFRTIAEDTLAQKSEAVLVALLGVSRAIYTDHNDIFVLACVWKQCFVSDWFSDQKNAADLLAQCTELQNFVALRSSVLCGSFLRNNNVDAVHRLIEIYLQYNQKEACANSLRLLFNHQYFRKDLRACAEIVKSCSELDMPLTETQNEQFLSLFLTQSERSRETSAMKQRTTPKEFQYKF